MSDDSAKTQRDLSGKQALQEKLRAIRALYITAYNRTGELEPIAVEFFFAVGDLLEGHPPESLPVKKIDKSDFLKELRDD